MALAHASMRARRPQPPQPRQPTVTPVPLSQLRGSQAKLSSSDMPLESDRRPPRAEAAPSERPPPRVRRSPSPLKETPSKDSPPKSPPMDGRRESPPVERSKRPHQISDLGDGLDA